MLTSILIAVLIGVVVFTGAIYVSRQFSGEKASSKHRKKVLSRIYEEQEQFSQQVEQENISILKSDATPLAQFLFAVPGGRGFYQLVLKSGMGEKLPGVLFACTGLFFIAFILLSNATNAANALIGAAALTYFLPKKYLNRRIAKRNEAFINMFPDAVDMIVRSVKSGHPLNTALKMIAENMDPPVRDEFRQLVDEIAFGRSTTEALVRLSKRIDEADLHFFVVILSVQQETGGNLAEVLGNLSSIIRKRKQLRLKIKALTSEGRATGYILGALPLCIALALHIVSPDYLVPLFTTTTGNICIAVALGLIGLAAFIVHGMLQIDI